MTNMLKDIARSEEGFTLIELLVVILIIGILLAVALPTFLGQQDKAKDTDAKSKLNTTYKTIKSEATSNEGNFPATFAELSGVLSSDEGITLVTGTHAPANGSDDVVINGFTANNAATSYTLYARSGSNAACELAITGTGGIVDGDPDC